VVYERSLKEFVSDLAHSLENYVLAQVESSLLVLNIGLNKLYLGWCHVKNTCRSVRINRLKHILAIRITGFSEFVHRPIF
jgi:hypothetical protein